MGLFSFFKGKEQSVEEYDEAGTLRKRTRLREGQEATYNGSSSAQLRSGDLSMRLGSEEDLASKRQELAAMRQRLEKPWEDR